MPTTPPPITASRRGTSFNSRILSGHRVQLGGLEQSVGGAAAPDQPCAANPVFLHEGGRGAELGGPQSADVAPRAAADHDYVKPPRHSSYLYVLSTEIMPSGSA